MVRNRTTTKARNPDHSPTDEIKIPEDEQLRLIKESGIMDKITRPSQAVDEKEITPLGEEMFGAAILIVPFCFLLLLMDILINFQYGKQPSFETLVDRLGPGVPILSIFIFYTTRYKAHRWMQASLFILSILSGARVIYLINMGSWLVNMQQCPPLATIWIYTAVQLELLPAVLALITVGIYVWWNGLRILL